jgi:uncharacterized damage-inducible protein DinB
MKSLLVDYAKHNLWASLQYTQALKTNGTEILEKEIISSFTSIMKTIVHIHAAQNIWYARLNGEKGSFPNYESFSNSEEIFESWISSSKALLQFIENVTEEDLDSIKKFILLNGDSMENEVKDMFLHCINHSNFHRGQLVTMMRQLGFTTIPATDYIKFKRLNIEF